MSRSLGATLLFVLPARGLFGLALPAAQEPSLQTDIRNAGGDWVDREVVVDEGLVTSRKPDDIPAFNRKMIEEFGEGIHAGQRASARATRTTGTDIEAR